MSKLITAICPTFNRPKLLGRAIRAFEKQTYENRFLIIVDDLGQYKNQGGKNWRLVSFPQRIMSLGEKNNVCAALAPRETWAYAKWDDDDIYMPWHLEALADALSIGEWVQPRHAIDFWNGRWCIVETFNRRNPNKFCYHGCWAYTRELFKKVGGYRGEYAGDDGEFQNRLLKKGFHSVDIDPRFQPSYWYNRPLTNRISEKGGSADVYWGMMPDPLIYAGEVPKWQDETVWDKSIPTEVIRRPW
jgi:glycosyltransferase involved in cell wall biosynthesis